MNERPAHSMFPDKGDLFQDLFDSNPQPMWVYDLETYRFMAVNDAAVRLYGYSREEFLSMSITQIRPQEEVDRLVAMVSKLRLGVQRSGQWTHRRKDGTLINVEISSHGVLFGGRESRFVIVQDVTARMQAVEALRRSEEKYRDLFENANDAIFIMGPDLRYRDANKKACDILGYTREELTSLTVFDLIPPEQVPQSQAEFDRLRDRGSYEKFIGKIRTKDGRWLDVEVSSSAIVENGAIAGSRDIVRDITDRKRMEDELLRAQKLESIGVLAGGIAHDFNNLLTAIMGNLSLAKLSTRSGDGIHEALEQAERASDRAQALTQQLLTFSRGGAPIRKTLDIAALVRETVAFSLRGARTLSEFAIAEDLWPVDGDEGQLSQLFNNLAINADQAMPGGGTLRVECSNSELTGSVPPLAPGAYVKISFMDRGVGISAANLKRIFDPYFTTKSKGSGLGLATCYSIVKRHDGQITVDSGEGAGTTFHIYLPRSMSEVRKEQHQLRRELTTGSGSILVMDDEAMIRSVATAMLGRLGYRVDCASDGEEALSMYAKARTVGRPYDAVILDLTVPGGMGGAEAVERILAMDPAAQVIVSSGYSNDPVMADHRTYGFRGVISKPYSIQKLEAALGSLRGQA